MSLKETVAVASSIGGTEPRPEEKEKRADQLEWRDGEYVLVCTLYTGLGKKVVPRLRESRFLIPSGCGVRVHTI